LKFKNLFNITDRTALRDLSELVDLEILKKDGEKKGAKYLLK